MAGSFNALANPYSSTGTQTVAKKKKPVAEVKTGNVNIVDPNNLQSDVALDDFFKITDAVGAGATNELNARFGVMDSIAALNNGSALDDAIAKGTQGQQNLNDRGYGGDVNAITSPTNSVVDPVPVKKDWTSDLDSQLLSGAIDINSINPNDYSQPAVVQNAIARARRALRMASEQPTEISNTIIPNRNSGTQEATRNEDPVFRSSTANTAPTVSPIDVAIPDAPDASIYNSNQSIAQQQMDLMREILGNADAAGKSAIESVKLPDFQLPEVRTKFGQDQLADRTVSPLEERLNEYYLRGIDPNYEDPRTRSLLADHEAKVAQDEKQLKDYLNYIGALGDGDSIDAFSDFRTGNERNRLSILGDAESRRDALAASGSAFLSDRDYLDLAESEMVGNLRGLPTLQAQALEAQTGLSLAQLAENARQFEGNFGMELQRLGQDVTDRVAARESALTTPTGREQFEEGVRQARFAEGLASSQNARDQALLESNLFGETNFGGPANAAPRSTLQGRGFEDDLLSSSLNRSLATRGQDLNEQLRDDQVNQDTLNRNLRIQEMLGTISPFFTGGSAQETLQSRQLTRDNERADSQLDLLEAELFGEDSSGNRTLGGQQFDSSGRQVNFQNARDLLDIAIAAQDAGIDISGFDIPSRLNTLFGDGNTTELPTETSDGTIIPRDASPLPNGTYAWEDESGVNHRYDPINETHYTVVSGNDTAKSRRKIRR